MKRVLYTMMGIGFLALCAGCGMDDIQPLEYTLSQDETYYICSGIGSYQGSEVEIAKSYEGLLVKEVGKDAFNGVHLVNSITMPEGIEVIENFAFKNCRDLKTIHFPESLTHIGSNIIEETSVEYLDIPDNAIYLNSSAFEYANSLKGVKLPLSLGLIPEELFNSTESLEYIVLGSDLFTIDFYAFLDSGLKKIYSYKEDYREDMVIEDGNEAFIQAKWYQYSENGAAEAKIGSWWYYDTDNVTIIEKINES